MKNKSTYVPDIIKNLNPVTKQFDPISQKQISDTVQDDPSLLHRLLTKAEQAICDLATD